MISIQNWSHKEFNCCPICDKKAIRVPLSAISHFLTEETKANIPSLENFYFCETPSCDAVYFRNNFTIKQNELKFNIGLKEGSSPTVICYCFHWTKEKIEEQIKQTGETTAIEEIKNKIHTKEYNCEVNNPKGRCCLTDIKKVIKELST